MQAVRNKYGNWIPAEGQSYESLLAALETHAVEVAKVAHIPVESSQDLLRRSSHKATVIHHNLPGYYELTQCTGDIVVNNVGTLYSVFVCDVTKDITYIELFAPEVCASLYKYPKFPPNYFSQACEILTPQNNVLCVQGNLEDIKEYVKITSFCLLVFEFPGTGEIFPCPRICKCESVPQSVVFLSHLSKEGKIELGYATLCDCIYA